VYTKQQWIAEQAREHPDRVFTSLHHLIDREWMLEAYRRTRKDGAAGIDGETAADYETQLEANLESLLVRIKSGRYHAPAVRRHYIPKADGSKRPLGIPTFEDKVAQRAILMLVEPLYEQDFLPCSYGFRRGRSAHHALRALRTGIMEQGHRWVIDADISKYFDSIDHRHLRSFLDLRIRDGVIRRMIDKWLKAGVLEEGTLRKTEAGTPQGGVISPLLANLFLHHVLDVWFEQVAKPRLRGHCQLVRYADDFVMSFEDHLSGRRMLAVLGQRLARFGLTLHASKTRYVDFRFKRPQGQHPATAGTSFTFLGFTHVWGRSGRSRARL
jgi:RNA-directed DNA polymerase